MKTHVNSPEPGAANSRCTVHSTKPEHPVLRVGDSGVVDRFPGRPGVERRKRIRSRGALWRESLTLMQQHVTFRRRTVVTDEVVYRCGEECETRYLVNCGVLKIVNLAADGREQSNGLYLKGDWLGFDGIPSGKYGCSAVSLDVGELWAIRYDNLLRESAKEPALMRLVLSAISAQLARNRDATLSLSTLSADARVADFLLQWAYALEERGMRTDQMNINMSRASIGNFLGIRLESVSRAMSRLSRMGVIEFHDKEHKAMSVPCLDSLKKFIDRSSMIDGARLS